MQEIRGKWRREEWEELRKKQKVNLGSQNYAYEDALLRWDAL
jgi:hypothetical protein